MDKDNFFFPKSSLGNGFATRKFVNFEPLPNLEKNSYKPYNDMKDINKKEEKVIENGELQKHEESIKEKTENNQKLNDMITGAKEIYDKCAPKETVYMGGTPVQVDTLRGIDRQAMIAASLYAQMKKKSDDL